MRNVIVIAAGNDQRFFLTTLLGRQGMQLRIESSLRDVTQAVMKSPPNLLVVKEYDPAVTASELDELAKCYPSAPFPVLLISHSTEHPGLCPLVKKVLPATMSIPLFNETVAELLNLPSRRSARFPIRIGIDLSAPATSAIANTVNISSSGMLIESPKILYPGKTYMFRFMAVAKVANVPPIHVRVVREENNQPGATGPRRYALEFVGMDPSEMDKIIDQLLS